MGTSGTVTDTGTDATEYNVSSATTFGGRDEENVVDRDSGTDQSTRTDNLLSTKAQSSITTVDSVMQNNLTDETSHTGTINKSTETTNDLEETDNADRTLHEEKHGNIGVSSIQRMFKEEIENWKWTYMNTVFADIDAFLVLAVY